jgi:dipeptidyl aminopeptidase/acylaminoacyl peptidase
VRQADTALHLFTARPDGSERTQLTFDGAYNVRQAWSPDGEWIAFVRTDDYNGPGDAWVVRPDGTDTRRVFENVYGDGFSHLAWRPDSKWLAVPHEEGGLWIVSIEEDDDWLVPGTSDLACQDPAWAPTEDGWPLLFQVSGEQHGLWIYAPDVAEEAWRLSDVGWGPSWAPGGTHLASAFVSRQDDVEHIINFFALAPRFLIKGE